MPIQMIEKPMGTFLYCDGQRIEFDSLEANTLFEPTEDTIYYESIRFREQTLLFFEAHMLRLHLSVAAKEDFEFDSEKLYEQAQRLIRDSEPKLMNGNLRIVLTSKHSVVHLTNVQYPDEDSYKMGIVTTTLKWERVEPHIKVFRDDYKRAVAKSMKQDTPFGAPYEVLLLNQSNQITEGSRSNFFVLHNDTVYSPPEKDILIGITRKYVLKAIVSAGMKYEEKSFSLDEIIALKNDSQEWPVVFVTSSPFDILPIKSIDDVKFNSSQSKALAKISDSYQNIVDFYIQSRSSDQDVIE